jgi:hypothetical protein
VKLAVIQTNLDAYRIWFANFSIYLRLIWFPFLAQTALEVYTDIYVPGLDLEDRNYDSMLTPVIGATIASLVVAIPAATAWHRLIIIGVNHRSSRIEYSLSSEEGRYLGRSILLLLFVVLVVIVFVFFGVFLSDVSSELPGWASSQLAVVVFLMLWLLLVVHFLLVLPAAAVGDRVTFGESLRATRGNGWRLYLIYLLASLPGLIAGYVWNHINFGQFAVRESEVTVVYLIGRNMFFYLTFTLNISVLSIAYKKIFK